MKKLINYLKRNNINHKLIDNDTIMISFNDNLILEIKVNKKPSQKEYQTTLTYNDTYLFEGNNNSNLKEIIKNISYLQSLIKVYGFNNECIKGLVYFNSIYKPIY